MKINKPVVTIGSFDGLHIGHWKIFNKMKEIADEINGETVVLTFKPHPRIVLQKDHTNLFFLNSAEEKIELLESMSIDHLIIINFTKEFSELSSEEFVKNIIVDKLKSQNMVVGYDHHFGKSSEGDIILLGKMGVQYSFNVEMIHAQNISGVAVSSTKIRNALTNGNIETANKYLGYEYSIEGMVVAGEKIGREIGFPTANIETNDKHKLIPAYGVYAVKVQYDGRFYNAMLNIGVRPTFKANKRVIEVNIFNFKKSIYNERIKIFFIKFIRKEKRFKNIDSLKTQIANDKDVIIGLFSETNHS